VKVVEVKFLEAKRENPNSLNTIYGKPPYKIVSKKLDELKPAKEFIIDFKTEKGKTYTIIPL